MCNFFTLTVVQIYNNMNKQTKRGEINLESDQTDSQKVLKSYISGLVPVRTEDETVQTILSFLPTYGDKDKAEKEVLIRQIYQMLYRSMQDKNVKKAPD